MRIVQRGRQIDGAVRGSEGKTVSPTIGDRPLPAQDSGGMVRDNKDNLGAESYVDILCRGPGDNRPGKGPGLTHDITANSQNSMLMFKRNILQVSKPEPIGESYDRGIGKYSGPRIRLAKVLIRQPERGIVEGDRLVPNLETTVKRSSGKLCPHSKRKLSGLLLTVCGGFVIGPRARPSKVELRPKPET